LNRTQDNCLVGSSQGFDLRFWGWGRKCEWCIDHSPKAQRGIGAFTASCQRAKRCLHTSAPQIASLFVPKLGLWCCSHHLWDM